MSDPYEEILDGDRVLRFPPGERHEQICDRLELRLSQVLGPLSAANLLPRRTRISLHSNNAIRPDLAIITKAGGKLLLAIEIVGNDDHRPDTVTKKGIYEDQRIPRLWMVDPRYDNVEIYHGKTFGLTLKSMLAGSDVLTDPLLPGFGISIHELFQAL